MVAAAGPGPVNPRNTAILAVLAALLGAFIWFYEIQGEDARAKAEDAEKQLFAGVETDDVTAIVLRTTDGHDARLERDAEGDGWRLVEPLPFAADTLTADGLASSLAELASEAVFDDPEPLAAYGLDTDPALHFEVGDTRHALRIGDKTPVGGNTYLAAEGDARVFAAATWRVTALDKTLLDLRDRSVLDFDRDAVRGLRASWDGGEVALVREGEVWKLVEPIASDADSNAVDGLLSNLQFLRADGFVDDPGLDEATGLDAPLFAIELDLGEGAEPVRMAVSSVAQGALRQVRGQAEGALYLIPEARAADFPRDVVAYRFKQLADFPVSDARDFEIHFGGTSGSDSVTGTRGDQGWTVTPRAMAPGLAARLVSELAMLEAADIAADAMGPDELAELSLSPPAVEIRVRGGADGADDVLADVSLGGADPSRGIAAMRAGDPVVYWLDFELAEHLPVSREAFANRFVAEQDETAPDPDDAMTDEAASSPE